MSKCWPSKGQTILEYLLIVSIVAAVVFIALMKNGSLLFMAQQEANMYFEKGGKAIAGGYYNPSGSLTNSAMPGEYVAQEVRPINGGWCIWGACIDGYQERECACPRPVFGGLSCDGAQSRTCSGGVESGTIVPWLPGGGTCVMACGSAVCGPSNCPGQDCGPACPAGQECQGGQCVLSGGGTGCVSNCATNTCNIGNCGVCPCDAGWHAEGAPPLCNCVRDAGCSPAQPCANIADGSSCGGPNGAGIDDCGTPCTCANAPTSSCDADYKICCDPTTCSAPAPTCADADGSGTYTTQGWSDCVPAAERISANACHRTDQLPACTCGSGGCQAAYGEDCFNCPGDCHPNNSCLCTSADDGDQGPSTSCSGGPHLYVKCSAAGYMKFYPVGSPIPADGTFKCALCSDGVTGWTAQVTINGVTKTLQCDAATQTPTVF